MGAVAGWYISPESLQKGYDPGIDDYMVKSGDFSGLFMRVRALLRRANIEASRKLLWRDKFFEKFGQDI